MSVFEHAENGTKLFRSRFNLSFRKLFDCKYGELVPILNKFCLPGDVWKPGANILARLQPMMAPTLTSSSIRVRYFFVPLRLVEEDTEMVITGSDNGKLIETALPTFENIFNRIPNNGDFEVKKYSFLDYLGCPTVDYKTFKDDNCLPAGYWAKGYCRLFYDYYRDENFDEEDFDTFVNDYMSDICNQPLLSVRLRKDYLTSSLPWQLKGVAPAFDVTGYGSTEFYAPQAAAGSGFVVGDDLRVTSSMSRNGQFFVTPPGSNPTDNDYFISALNKNTVRMNNLSFNMDDIRTLAAQTRIFERLARCGSRFTEYLRSNFGVSPADGTLQRAQYLGGFSQPILSTEIAQTGQDGETPVGTLRGKGISSGGSTISRFVCKEPGMIYGILDVMPRIQYTQGIDRDLTYKARWDFFNPSFQHLSEQEVRNGEIYIGNDGKNDKTFGFQAIYNELRSSRDLVVGDFRDNLSYWTQAVTYSVRPNLSKEFLDSSNYRESFNKPYDFVGADGCPILIDCANILDVYRPMVRYSTPGLIDHL